MAQYGFYYDADSCVGCRACQVACKDVNRLEVGQNFRKVTSYCTGSNYDVRLYHTSIACNHCASPACVANCPTGAMHKDEETGIVLHDDDICIGCESCVKACPYDAPVFIKSLDIVKKCDGCASLREAGETPSCVASCPMRALEFGDIEELESAHAGEALVSEIAALASSSETMPSLLMHIKERMLDEEYTIQVL